MTDTDIKALVERLRLGRMPTLLECDEAADALEALQAENERHRNRIAPAILFEANDVIEARNSALEEAVKVVEGPYRVSIPSMDVERIAAAIRALKEKP